jgi:hypothetical protein
MGRNSAAVMRAALIAPCGMNCRLCVAYTRAKNPCPGCRGEDRGKAKTRFLCRIKKCAKRGGGKYCSSCQVYPCDWITHLDRRYRTKYAMSMCDNLERIRTSGVRRFLREEKERWTCSGCVQILTVHRPQCLSCGRRWRPDAPRLLRENASVRLRREEIRSGRSGRPGKKKRGHTPFR